jgi:hypothetical protein
MPCATCTDLSEIIDGGLGACFSDFRTNVSLALESINDLLCECSNCTVDVPVNTHPRDFIEVGWGGLENLPSYENCPRLMVNMGCDMWIAPNKPLECDLTIEGNCWQLICYDCNTGTGVDTDDQTAAEVPYTPSDPSKWADPDPTNVQQALDVLAVLYSAGTQAYAAVEGAYNQTIVFNSGEFDAPARRLAFPTLVQQSPSGIWDAANNQFVAPFDGLYLVNMHLTLAFLDGGVGGASIIDAIVGLNNAPNNVFGYVTIGTTPHAVFVPTSATQSVTAQRLMALTAGRGV